MVKRLINPLKRMGSFLIFSARTATGKVGYVVMLAVTMLMVSQPASAVEVATAAAPAPPNINVMCFFGAPDIGWLSGLQPATRDLTGKGLGVLILIAMVVGIGAGVKVMLSGRDTNKAQEGTTAIVRVFLGLALVIGCFLVFAVVVAALFGIISFAC